MILGELGDVVTLPTMQICHKRLPTEQFFHFYLRTKKPDTITTNIFSKGRANHDSNSFQ